MELEIQKGKDVLLQLQRCSEMRIQLAALPKVIPDEK